MQCQGERVKQAELCLRLEEAVGEPLDPEALGRRCPDLFPRNGPLPLMGIWATTSGDISYVCGAPEDSKTIIGPVTLDRKASLRIENNPSE